MTTGVCSTLRKLARDQLALRFGVYLSKKAIGKQGEQLPDESDPYNRELVMKRMFIIITTQWLCAQVMAAPPDGKALYQENCARCHGQNGKGDTGPRLVGDASEWKRELFERAVLQGIDDEGKPLKSPMPHWRAGSFKTDKGVAPSKAEVDAIQRYLHTLK